MNEQFGLEVQLHSEQEHPIEREPVKVFLFRAVQELLFNIVKHSNVKTASVHMAHSDGHLSITVLDGGKGFDTSSLGAASSSGLGLLSLGERTRHMGGVLDIASSSGKGCRVTLTIPEGVLRSSAENQTVREPSYIPAAPNPPENGDAIRVLLVDDHQVMRAGLSRLLQTQRNVLVIGEASDGIDAVEQTRRLKPDVILMDIAMHKLDGIEATKRIKREMPNVRIVGLSMYQDKQIAQKMIDAGAEAYISKASSAADELVLAILGADASGGSMDHA
jgi:CheY-like chemotaxis protein